MQVSKERIGALFFLLLSVAYGYFAGEIKLYPGDEMEAMTAQTLPFSLSMLGIGFSIILLFTGKKDTAYDDSIKDKEWLPVIILLLLAILYGLALDWLGFLISTTLFLIGGFWTLGERRIKILLFVSIPFVFIFWFGLTQLLDIYLAPGQLFTNYF